MRRIRMGETRDDRGVRRQETFGRRNGGVGVPGRTEIKSKIRIKRKKGEACAALEARLREKHMADLADPKKTLEITGLIDRAQVRHVADLEWKREAGAQNERRNVQTLKMYDAEGVGSWGSMRCKNTWRSWRSWRSWKNRRGIWRFSRPPQGRQVAVLEWASL
jgi:hypothetical protein